MRGTKVLVWRKVREILTDIDQGLNPTPSDINLSKWLNRRQRIQETYRNVIDRHIVPHLGGVASGSPDPPTSRPSKPACLSIPAQSRRHSAMETIMTALH